MIEKRTPFEAQDQYGEKARLLDFSGNAMQKLASSLETYVPAKLQKAIRDVQQSPDPNFAYLYDRALGAGEVYGANNNGDFFPKKSLQSHHGTFVTHAHLFRHHQNKDPRNKVGDVLASAYNDKLDTVDLLIRAPKSEISKDLDKLERGGVIATSMGAGVPFDQCNICGKKARTRMAYCTHLRNQMLKVMPDGRQVYAINEFPKFKDISIVVIPAAPESGIINKVASLKRNLASRGIIKNAYMKKDDIGFDSREGRGVVRPEIVDSTNHLDREDALQTIHEAYGPLRPDEFQAVLNKDASLLRPDCIPYVNMESTPSRALKGYPIMKLAEVFRGIRTLDLDKNAKDAPADFLDKFEKRAYLSYRNAWPVHKRLEWKNIFLR